MFLLSAFPFWTHVQLSVQILTSLLMHGQKTFHMPFGLFSQSHSDLYEEIHATAQARWTFSPMIPAFGEQSQS